MTSAKAGYVNIAAPIPDQDQSLKEIIAACAQGGDMQAWHNFVRQTQPVIAATVIKTGRGFPGFSRELADDLIQESYLRVYKEGILKTFRSEEPNRVYGLLQALAYSVVLDHFRAKNAQKRGGEIHHISIEAVGPAKDRASTSGIESRLLIREIEELLHEIAPLARDRHIFWLYHRHEFTAEEISLLPAISLTAKGVESVIYRLTTEVRRRMVLAAKQSIGSKKGFGS